MSHGWGQPGHCSGRVGMSLVPQHGHRPGLPTHPQSPFPSKMGGGLSGLARVSVPMATLGWGHDTSGGGVCLTRVGTCKG